MVEVRMTDTDLAVFQRAFERALVPAFIGDDQGRHIAVNDAYCQLLGYSREQLLEMSIARVFRAEEREDAREMLTALLEGKTSSFIRQYHFIRSDGRELDIEAGVSVVQMPETGGVNVLVQVIDITQALEDARAREEAENLLKYLADHDPLTGLLNRRAFDQLLEDQVERAKLGRRREHAALLMLDLDGFKHHNDTFGHQSGDAVLVAVSEAIQTRLRDTDMIGRMGGDEMAVLLPGTTVVEAESVAAALVELVARVASSLEHDAENPVTVSIGITDFADAPDAETVIGRADAALYDAKEQGRSRWAVRI